MNIPIPKRIFAESVVNIYRFNCSFIRLMTPLWSIKCISCCVGQKTFEWNNQLSNFNYYLWQNVVIWVKSRLAIYKWVKLIWRSILIINILLQCGSLKRTCIFNAYCQFYQQMRTNFMQTCIALVNINCFFILPINLHWKM